MEKKTAVSFATGGCFENVMLRKKRFFISDGPNSFFVWDSVTGLRRFSTAPGRMSEQLVQISTSFVGAFDGKRLVYVDLGDGKDRGKYTPSVHNPAKKVVTSDKWIYFIGDKAVRRIDKSLNPTTDKLIDLKTNIDDLVPVGEVVFVKTGKKGQVLSALLEKLTTVDDTSAIKGPMVSIGVGKVVTLGQQSALFNIETEDSRELTKQQILVQALRFPDGKVAIVIVTLKGDVKFLLYRDDSLDNLLLSFTEQGANKRYFVFDRTRLLCVEEKKELRLLDLRGMLRGEEKDPVLECTVPESRLGATTFPIPLEGAKDRAETTRIRIAIQDMSGFDDRAAEVVARFI